MHWKQSKKWREKNTHIRSWTDTNENKSADVIVVVASFYFSGEGAHINISGTYFIQNETF